MKRSNKVLLRLDSNGDVMSITAYEVRGAMVMADPEICEGESLYFGTIEYDDGKRPAKRAKEKRP